MAFSAQELERALGNPNVRQFLDLISLAEGTGNRGYSTAFGGGEITDLSDHPRQLHDFTQTDGRQNKTSAAGRYQFLQGTWDDVAGKLGLPDFSPKSQDIAAVELLRRNGALPALMKGDFDTAVQLSGKTWASLPSSPYAQPKRSPGFIAQALDKTAQAVFPAANAAPPGAAVSGLPAGRPQQPQMSTTRSAAGFSAMSDDQLLSGLRPRSGAGPSQLSDDELLNRLQPGAASGYAAMSDDDLLAGLQGKEPDSLGRQVGLTARAAINGVTGLPNMLWNGVGGVVNWATGQEVVPKADADRTSDWLGLPRPQNQTERISQDVAGAMAGTGVVTKVAEKAANAAGPVVKYIAGLFADKPVTQLAGAGLASAASGYARERGAGPGVQVAAGLVGGLTPSVATAVGRGVARPFAPLVSQKAAQAVAGNRVANMAQTEPDLLALRLHQVGDELVPGSAPTTAQAIDDTALLVAERGRRSARPEFNVAFNERTAAQNAAREQALDGISPTVGSAQDVGTDAGAVIRRMFDENYSGMKQQVRDAYAPLAADDAANMALPKTAAKDAVTKYFGPGSGGPDTELSALIRELDTLPDNVPFGTLQNLKSWAGDIQAKARAAFDNRKAAAAGEVHAILDSVPSQMAANRTINPRTAAQFELAKSLRREQADRFETGPAQNMRRQGSDRAALLQGREIPRAFFNNSPTSEADIRQFMRAVGDREQAVQALRNYAVAGLRDFTTKGGTQPFRAADFRRWLSSHGPALRTVFADKHLNQLNAIADDLERAARSNTAGRAPGSDTVMNLSSQAGWELLLDRFPAGARVIFGVGRALSGDRVGALVDRAMLDPEFAQVLLARATERNKARLANLLQKAYVGTTYGTATTTAE